MVTEEGATISVGLGADGITLSGGTGMGTEEGSTEGEGGEVLSKAEEDLEERRRGIEEGLEDLPDDRRDDLEEDFLTADEDTTGTLG